MRTALPLPLLLCLVAGLMGGQSPSESAKLHELFEQEWQRGLRESPVSASYLGDQRFNDRWGDLSLNAIAASYALSRRALERLEAIDRSKLSAADKLNYDLFHRSYRMDLEGERHRWFLVPLDQRWGIQTANDVAAAVTFETLKDYEDWLARLRAFPRYMDQTIDLMRQGIEEGIVQPRVVMERLPGQIDRQIPQKPGESLFFKPFRKFPDVIGEDDRKRLEQQALQATSDHVIPAYRRFKRFFEEEYLPACQGKIGASRLPGGRERYAYFARMFTTTEMTPRQIHERGLSEVERIRAEMDRVITELGFEGSFEEFLEFLRTDPRFYFKTGEELLAAYRTVAKRIDPTLPKLFGKLPRTPYGVEPIPDNIAPDTTAAYYRPLSGDGRRPGIYSVNLYKPESRPIYEMEALSIHEAVPGHHLQIALATELGELPEFRKHAETTAFVEGWALYAESLGEELGFYQDPYSKFGQLTYEMWRAVRLVVDTGMHDMDWSRERAIAYFKANAAKTEQDIVNEIDRYIAWPGQALAYKIGELKIKELRARAEKRLGSRFDVRAFHDVVLGAGAIPLDVLDARVDAWLESLAETN